MHSLIALLMLGLTSGTSWAQQSNFDKETDKLPRVISIRLTFSSGMCYGYCHTELTIEHGDATLLTGSWERDGHQCPDLKVRSDLSEKHWKELLALVDHQALLALPESIGCPGCVDEVVEGIEVRFSDHTKKRITYNMGSAPKEIKALSEKLSALEKRLSKELPPVAIAQCRM